VVREGDTLAQISEETGIDVDEILAMNPDLDPQVLIQGQRIALR
jgi:LysM repeat protein